MKNPPCGKICPDRYVVEHSNCHATCERYLEWEKERKEELEAKNRDKILEGALIDMRRNLKRK
jgi:epoxyqueuosine reductase QueG